MLPIGGRLSCEVPWETLPSLASFFYHLGQIRTLCMFKKDVKKTTNEPADAVCFMRCHAVVLQSSYFISSTSREAIFFYCLQP